MPDVGPVQRSVDVALGLESLDGDPEQGESLGAQGELVTMSSFMWKRLDVNTRH